MLRHERSIYTPQRELGGGKKTLVVSYGLPYLLPTPREKTGHIYFVRLFVRKGTAPDQFYGIIFTPVIGGQLQQTQRGISGIISWLNK
jgi:hypothetical protein